MNVLMFPFNSIISFFSQAERLNQSTIKLSAAFAWLGVLVLKATDDVHFCDEVFSQSGMLFATNP